jgi:hypothetical protein
MDAEAIDVEFRCGRSSMKPLSVCPITTRAFRLLEWPMMCLEDDRLIPGAIVECSCPEPGVLVFERLLEESPLIHYTCVVSEQLTKNPALQKFLDSLEAQGCLWERVFGGVLSIFYLPSSGIDPAAEIRRIIDFKDSYE